MNIKKEVLGMLAPLLLSAAAVASVPPPTGEPNSFPIGTSTSDKPLSRGFHMGQFNILFEETTLAKVQETVGAGDIALQGDAGDAIYWLCYTVVESKTPERIWIVSSAEMGGPAHTVNGVTALADKSAAATPDCPSLPKRLEPLSFDGGVWLGMKKVEAVRILGPKPIRRKVWNTYIYQGKSAADCDSQGSDTINSLEFRSTGNTLIEIDAGQTTSC